MHTHRPPRCSPGALATVTLLGSLGLLGPLGACSSDTSYVIVTVDSQPAVLGARSLTVALSNGGTTRMDNLALNDRVFPVTFSISTPGRTGDLAIAVDATDENGLVVGHGTATTTTVAPDASVKLASTDFVVNTDYAGDQFPSDDFEASGFQLAALPDGTWTAAFRDACPTGGCTMYARRFDKAGKPAQTQIAASTNAFPLTTTLTTFQSTPAIASGATTTLALWDYYDVQTTTLMGVACRALDTGGGATATQTTIGTDGADVVSVAALASGNFVASWSALPPPATTSQVRTAIIKPDCTALAGPLTVSTPADSARRASVATNGDLVLFTWVVDGSLHVRTASAAGVLGLADTVLALKTATDEVAYARVAAATGGGFVVAVRWEKIAPTGPGRIELFRVTAAGKAAPGMPTLVTDKSASDFDNSESFAIASRPDGSVLVAWHTCGALGDDSQCGVFGRMLHDTGDPITDVFVIPTTTQGDQRLPSVVGVPDGFIAMWSDASAQKPDVAGTSVRARVLYMPGN